MRGHYVWRDETNPALVALRDALLEQEVGKKARGRNKGARQREKGISKALVARGFRSPPFNGRGGVGGTSFIFV